MMIKAEKMEIIYRHTAVDNRTTCALSCATSIARYYDFTIIDADTFPKEDLLCLLRHAKAECSYAGDIIRVAELLLIHDEFSAVCKVLKLIE